MEREDKEVNELRKDADVFYIDVPVYRRSARGGIERRIEMTILILKFICLLLACVYGFSNIGKIIVGHGKISNIQMFLMGFGVAGFIFLQWVL